MHGYMVEADLSQTCIYMYPKHASIWENVASVTGTMIIVQTNIHHRSKLFTTGQARVNLSAL